MCSAFPQRTATPTGIRGPQTSAPQSRREAGRGASALVEKSGAGTHGIAADGPVFGPTAACGRSVAQVRLGTSLSWARWGKANPCFSPTLPPQRESGTRIHDRRGLLVCGFHWDAGATNLITELHVRILTRTLWRVDSMELVVPDHRFRHCSTSTRSLSVERTTPADDGG